MAAVNLWNGYEFAGSTSLEALKGENSRSLRKPFTNADLLAAIDYLSEFPN